jgi:hypothetical protein
MDSICIGVSCARILAELVNIKVAHYCLRERNVHEIWPFRSDFFQMPTPIRYLASVRQSVAMGRGGVKTPFGDDVRDAATIPQRENIA